MAIKVGVVGATGYAGVELLRILLGHPAVEIAAISSVSYEGKAVSEVYPSLQQICDKTLVDEQAVVDACDVVFASLPHGLSENIAKKCDQKGALFIDLGADFRLYDEADYTEWYGGLTYRDKALHQKAVYALPELFREQIRGKKILGNPGCYPTSIGLALFPLLQSGAVDPDTIVIDSKSGVTGAGRGLSLTAHYPECNEAFSPYKIAMHRHTPEIEQTLSIAAGRKVRVTFVPHLLPVNRGIVSTIYAAGCGKQAAESIHKILRDAYAGEKFVRVLPLGTAANLKNVKYSNYCDLSVHFDGRTGRVILVSAIDNMVKGAAGQAVQNMNIALGLPEDSGLQFVPPAI